MDDEWIGGFGGGCVDAWVVCVCMEMREVKKVYEVLE